jgi:LAS superfamily LD-carboxypeptidase LdcB
MKTYQSTLLTLGLPLLLLQACAYNRPEEVTAQMARTEATLQQAEQNGAAEKSLPELQSARDKFADAKKSLSKDSKEGDQNALVLAKQAQVDAQFATAKAQASRQQSATHDAQQGVNALRDEAARNANATAPETTK